MLRKVMIVPALIAALLVSPLMTGVVEAITEKGIKDLVILQNVPEVDAETGSGAFQLKALHVYAEGHFMLASKTCSGVPRTKPSLQ